MGVEPTGEEGIREVDLRKGAYTKGGEPTEEGHMWQVELTTGCV